VTPQEAVERLRDTRAFYRDGWPQYRTALEMGADALEVLAALTDATTGYPPETIAGDVTYFGVEAAHAERMVNRLAVSSPSEAALWQVVARRNRFAEAALNAAARLDREEVDT
jgi:hypothetical protein